MQAYQQIDIEISNRDEVIERYIKERDELIAQRAAIAESELTEAVAKVNALGGYATVEPQKKSGTPRAPSTGPKKYRDPATGAEWSGQGGRPEWLVNQDNEQFLNPAWLATKAAKTAKTSQTQPSADSSVASVVDQNTSMAVASTATPLFIPPLNSVPAETQSTDQIMQVA